MEHDHSHATSTIPEGTDTTKDPVCGMTVAVGPTTRHAEFEDKSFYFCSDKCQTRSKADPWFYVTGRNSERPKAAPEGVQYTCPMHPESHPRRTWRVPDLRDGSGTDAANGRAK